LPDSNYQETLLEQAAISHKKYIQPGTGGSILASYEAEIHKIVVQDQANSSQDPISKITRAKWTGDVAQAAECLFYKCEALSSNTHPTKKEGGDTKEGTEEERRKQGELGTWLRGLSSNSSVGWRGMDKG
jgi:hypothetical protein